MIFYLKRNKKFMLFESKLLAKVHRKFFEEEDDFIRNGVFLRTTNMKRCRNLLQKKMSDHF